MVNFLIGLALRQAIVYAYNQYYDSVQANLMY